MRRRGRRLGSVLAVAACLLGAVGCRAPARPSASLARDAHLGRDARLARGSALYAAYCGGCHGADGSGGGAVARSLRMRPPDLRGPGLLGDASEDEIVARLLHGDALRTAPHGSAFATERQVAALEAYVGALAGQRWDRIRAGRVVYENACAACHGVYGTGEGVLGGLLARVPADLPSAARRYNDGALAGIIRRGIGGMPAFGDLLDAGEVRQLVAYVRVLSPGHRLYDTYCASCHGDDGHGVRPEDAPAPAIVGPPLDPARLADLPSEERRRRVLHMFERERGVMPHFRGTLEPSQLADIAAYLRAAIH